jgi:hypothetical protein
MDIVVVFEPGSQLLEDGDGVRPRVHADIVALEGFDEGLADTDALGAAARGEAGDKVQRGDEVHCLARGVGGAVVGEPLHRYQGADGVELALDAFQHHVADHLAADPGTGCGDPGHDLAVVGVDGEGNANHLLVPAGDLEAVGRPATIRGWGDDGALSGEVLLARSLLSGRGMDLEPLLREVAEAVGVPVLGVVSDGQTSVRRAVEGALPGVPHQLCQFHFLREAAHPVFEADRHAKVALKAEVRGVRPIERSLESREDPAAEVARGYCAAVRSAITDDGRTPLAASGLKLKDRLTAVADSLERVAEKGAGRRRSRGCSN